MVKHPAVFSEKLISIFARLLTQYNVENVLDPFAGTGKLALVKQYGYKGKVICNEIEPEWTESVYAVDEWHVGDAAYMTWARDNSIDAICTSPTYGNRMADHHNARDVSRRITYHHTLGRKLNEENTGMMQWGKRYRDKHKEVYAECVRVLKNGGIIILNVSDHIRKGMRIFVSDWHKGTLISLGLIHVETIEVSTKRMRFGENYDLRVPMEYIFIFQKGGDKWQSC